MPWSPRALLLDMDGLLVDTEAVVATLKADEAARKKVNEGLKQDIDSKTAVVATNKAKLDEIREQTKSIGEIKDLAQKVKTIRGEMDDLRQSIANNLTKLANLTEDNAQTIGRNDVLKSHTEMIARRESFFTKARIASIYPNYGFVTLSSGHLAGVVTGSTLDIVRGSQVVGKLLVTAVETNTASASIIPDSIAQGTVLMVGDQVAPTHKSAAGPKPVVPGKPAAKSPAKPAETPPSLDSGPGKAAEPDATPPATPEATPPATPEATPPATPEATPPAAGSN